MKLKSVVIILFIGLNTIGQIKYEKGYFITNEGIKTECLIKNENWDINDNNSEFTFKSDVNSNGTNKKFNDIKEISIYNIVEYKKFLVDAYLSENSISDIDAQRIPKLQKTTLFLKLILKGKASLYHYKQGVISRFFYTYDDSMNPEQLIFKKYFSQKNTIRKNEKYKYQLKKNLACSSKNDTDKINYNKSDLIKYFISYNKCSKEEYKIFDEFKKNPAKIKFKIKSGISSSSLILNRGGDIFEFKYDVDYGNKINILFGFELEFFPNSKGSKWSFYTDPHYRSFKGTKNVKTGAGASTLPENVSIDLKQIIIPLNTRHYFYLNNGSKFSLSLGANFNFDAGSSLIFEKSTPTTANIKPHITLIPGLGYHFNKLSFELKYLSTNIFEGPSSSWDSNYNNIDFLISYDLF